MCTAGAQTNLGLFDHKRDYENKRRNEEQTQDKEELAYTNASHLLYTGKPFADTFTK